MSSLRTELLRSSLLCREGGVSHDLPVGKLGEAAVPQGEQASLTPLQTS